MAMKWISIGGDAGTGESSVMRVHEETSRAILSKLDPSQPMNLIAIFGAARQGKSFLMNLLSGQEGLFKISNSREPCTQGVDLSGFTMNLEEFSALNNCMPVKKTNMRIGFVDAEGQGDRDITYDSRLVTPILLASKAVIFNWKDSLQVDRILNLLAVLARAAHGVDVGDEGKPFGHLHIIFRDWNFVDGTPDSVFEDLFRKEKGRGSEVAVRNQARATLQESFQSITVWLFPPPVASTRQLTEKISFSMLQPPFLAKLKELRGCLSSQLREPTLFNGKRLTGKRLSQLLPALVDVLNSDQVILPEPIFASMLKAEADGLRRQMIEAIEKECRRLERDGPHADAYLKEVLGAMLAAALSKLKEQLQDSNVADSADKILTELQSDCEREISATVRANALALSEKLQQKSAEASKLIERELSSLETQLPLSPDRLESLASTALRKGLDQLAEVPASERELRDRQSSLRSMFEERHSRLVALNEKALQAKKYELEKRLRKEENEMRKLSKKVVEEELSAGSPLLLSSLEKRIKGTLEERVERAIEEAETRSEAGYLQEQLREVLSAILLDCQEKYLERGREAALSSVREMKKHFDDKIRREMDPLLPMSKDDLQRKTEQYERDVKGWMKEKLEGWSVAEKDVHEVLAAVREYLEQKKEHYIEKNQRLSSDSARSRDQKFYDDYVKLLKGRVERDLFPLLPVGEEELKGSYQEIFEEGFSSISRTLSPSSFLRQPSLQDRLKQDMESTYIHLLLKNRNIMEELKVAELAEREKHLIREQERISRLYKKEQDDLQRVAGTHIQEAQALTQEVERLRRQIESERLEKEALMHRAGIERENLRLAAEREKAELRERAEKEREKRSIAEKAARDAAEAAALAAAAAEQAVQDAIQPLPATEDMDVEESTESESGRRITKKRKPLTKVDQAENIPQAQPKEDTSAKRQTSAKKRGPPAAAAKPTARSSRRSLAASKEGPSPVKQTLEEARAAAKALMEERIAARAASLKKKK